MKRNLAGGFMMIAIMSLGGFIALLTIKRDGSNILLVAGVSLGMVIVSFLISVVLEGDWPISFFSSCHCQSYHARTGLHVEDCPKFKVGE